MQVNTVIRSMLDARGASARGVSLDMGRNDSFVGHVARTTRVPSIGTVSDVADVLGYDLAVIDRATGEELGRVTPPRRTADEG